MQCEHASSLPCMCLSAHSPGHGTRPDASLHLCAPRRIYAADASRVCTRWVDRDCDKSARFPGCRVRPDTRSHGAGPTVSSKSTEAYEGLCYVYCYTDSVLSALARRVGRRWERTCRGAPHACRRLRAALWHRCASGRTTCHVCVESFPYGPYGDCSGARRTLYLRVAIRQRSERTGVKTVFAPSSWPETLHVEDGLFLAEK